MIALVVVLVAVVTGVMGIVGCLSDRWDYVAVATLIHFAAIWGFTYWRDRQERGQ